MPETHVADYKKKTVQEFVKLIKEYPIIGAVNMENLPASQLQKIRAQLMGKIVLRMTKRRIMKLAIEQAKDSKKGIEKIENYLEGMPALIFTKDNPFSLCKILEKNKSAAPAKSGQVASEDIVIKAGPTPFAPGPIIGELGALGIKTAVEQGKINIASDTVVVKKGENVSKQAAGILTRLDIKPMLVGLELTAVYENGEIFTKDVLTVDEDEYLDNIGKASAWAFNLAMDVAYPSTETSELLIQTAFRDAKALALLQDIMIDEVVDELLAKANLQAISLSSEVGELKAKENKEEKTEVKEEAGQDTKEEEKAGKPEETGEVAEEQPKEEEKKTGEQKQEENKEEKEEGEEEKETKEEVKEQVEEKKDITEEKSES